MPLVSVLLPYRQCEETIEEAVTSILDQRGVDFELIAIDDGSTDSGPARVSRLAARHRRIVPIATGGVGIIEALCAGLTRARGALIARMDGDDRALPDRLHLQAARLASDPDLGVIGTRVVGFPDHAVGPGMAHYIAWQNQLITPADHARELFIEAPLCHPSVMIRRSVLDRVGPWRDTGGPEDYDLWLRINAAGFAMAKLPQVLLMWRHHERRSTFRDSRYSLEKFRQAKAPFLATWLKNRRKPIAVWGAGATGKRLVRALEFSGIKPHRFVDIDPDKLGRRARGAPVMSPDVLEPGREIVVAAVGTRGARDEIRARLVSMGFTEAVDFICAA